MDQYEENDNWSGDEGNEENEYLGDDEENEENEDLSDAKNLNDDEENEKNVPTLKTAPAIQFVSDDQIQVIQQL